GPVAWLRRAIHPDVGVLPGPERGRFRDRDQPGPADRAREAARAGGHRRRLTRGGHGYHREHDAEPVVRTPSEPGRLMDRLRDRVILITGSPGTARARADPGAAP